MKNIDHNVQRVAEAMETMRHALAGARTRLGEGLQLTRTQLEILMMLSDGPRTTSELAKSLFLTQSAVTQTVDTLVRKELVERYHDPRDRRIIHLQLSDSGQQTADRLQALRRQVMERLVAQLTDTEVEALISINQKIADLVREPAVHETLTRRAK